MDRRHIAALDADRVMEDARDGREAVRRARAVRNDDVRLRQRVVIDLKDDRLVGVVGGRRDEHALGAGVEMGGRFLLRGEDAGAFENDIDAEILPGKLRRIALGEHFDRA
jgi:hypothetical protein